MLPTVKEKQADNSREFSRLTGHLSYSDINEIHFNLIDQAHIFSSVEPRIKLFFSTHKCTWPLETITHCTKTVVCVISLSAASLISYRSIFLPKERRKDWSSFAVSLAASLLSCQHSSVMFPALSVGKIKLALISHNNHSCKPLQTVTRQLQRWELSVVLMKGFGRLHSLNANFHFFPSFAEQETNKNQPP